MCMHMYRSFMLAYDNIILNTVAWPGTCGIPEYPRAGFMVGRENPTGCMLDVISSPSLPLSHTHTYTHAQAYYTLDIIYPLISFCHILIILYAHVLQLFRADLISAMKLPDSTPMESGSFLTIREPWRTEWEIGVQVKWYKNALWRWWGGGGEYIKCVIFFELGNSRKKGPKSMCLVS